MAQLEENQAGDEQGQGCSEPGEGHRAVTGLRKAGLMAWPLPKAQGGTSAPEPLVAAASWDRQRGGPWGRRQGPARLTVARGTMAARSFWLTKISDTAVSVVAVLGYSTCQAMGCVPERLLKLAISKFIRTTSLNELLLLEGSEGKWLLADHVPCMVRLPLSSKGKADTCWGWRVGTGATSTSGTRWLGRSSTREGGTRQSLKGWVLTGVWAGLFQLLRQAVNTAASPLRKELGRPLN